MDRIRSCLMEAETFHLLKPFQQEKIISMQFSLWRALLWLKDFKTVPLSWELPHKATAHSIFVQGHYKPQRLANDSDSHTAIFSFPPRVKSPQHPQHSFISSSKTCRKVCVMPWRREPLPQHPAEPQAGELSELSPLANSASHCHSSVLVWLWVTKRE